MHESHRENTLNSRWKPESKAAWLARNAEKLREHNREYKRRNRTTILARRRVLENTDAERARKLAWAKKHRPDLKRLAQKAAVKIGTVDYSAVLIRADGKCGICHRPFDLFGIEFDHILPLSKGGAHCEDNMQATHKFCNRSKGNRIAA